MTRSRNNLPLRDTPRAGRPAGPWPGGTRAITTIELLVSMAILLTAMLGVVGVFNISSDTATKTAAHAELLESSRALQDELQRQLSRIAPGLLIIESPPPTTVRAETREGPKLFRLRQDRLVFVAAHPDQDAFQSFTNRPRRIVATDPTTDPIHAAEALLYFGPGLPVASDGQARPLSDTNLTASDWIFAERAILLAGNPPNPVIPNWTPPDMTIFSSAGGMLDGGPLNPDFEQGKMDAVVSAASGAGGMRADASSLIQLMPGRSISGATPPIAALWAPNWTPASAKIAEGGTAPADFYLRTGTNFVPRLADFRIEWTDGRRIDPFGPDDDPATLADNDNNTRWFGLAPFPDSSVDLAAVDSTLRFQSRMRGEVNPANPSNPNATNPDNPLPETAAFSQVEWSPYGVTSDLNAAYRAVWRTDTWHLRPRALRFTYRLYDRTGRIKSAQRLDLDGDNNPSDPEASAAVQTRLGQEFSFVVNLQ